MSRLGDRALVRRIQAGDRDAFDELVTAFWSPVLGYFWRRMARSDAEELTQTVFVNVYRAIKRGGAKQLSHESSWAKYLFRTARNTLADHWRRSAGTPEIHLEDLEGEGHAWVDRLADPRADSDGSAALQSTETRAALEECLDELEVSGRRLAWLHFVEGRSKRDLARTMNRPESSVRMDMARVLGRLRTCLESKGVIA